MGVNIKGKNFLRIRDFEPDEIRYLLDLAKNFKDLKRVGVPHKYLEGKNIALIFEKTSTRTRCAFEVAGFDLGCGVTYLGPGTSQMGHKESVRDTALVLGRMYDGIEYRGFGQEIVDELAEYAGVPVWNGLTTEYHPTQALADLFTIEEHFGGLRGLNLVYMGDARNNVANSLMVACAKMGVNFTACGPESLMPDQELIDYCTEIGKETQSVIRFESDVDKGVHEANIIYTDVWVSMGEAEEIWHERIDLLKPYQVNKEVMEKASADCIFLHCLPAFHNDQTVIGHEIEEKYGIREMEVTNEVFISHDSLVMDQAENRMHTIKAVIYATMG